MNKIRKTLLVTLVILLTMSASSFAYEKEADEVYLNRDLLKKDIWNEYIKLDEFQKHYAENPKDAEAMIGLYPICRTHSMAYTRFVGHTVVR
jgi:hypothetical protein